MSLTFEDIETEVRRVAALEPGRTAMDMYYTPRDGIPECIFGVVMGNLGYHADLRDAVDRHREDSDCEPSILDALQRMGEVEDITDDEASWLESVQTGNDIRKTWAEAVEYADAQNS